MMYEEELKALLENAMQTDGAHHKQWFLGQCLKLVDPEHYDYLVNSELIDMGIAP